MAFWNRNVDKPTGPAAPSAPPTIPAPPPVAEIEEIEKLAELVPQRNQKGEYLWRPYVDRIIQRLGGLPAPDGGGSFVRACLAAGCKAVPVMRTSTLWEKDLSAQERWDAEDSGLAARVRLSLFLAASLRYLVHGLCRLRIKGTKGDWDPLQGGLRTGEVFWQPVRGGGVSFREFEAAHEGGLGITWLDVQPTDAQACTLVSYFLQAYDRSLLTLEQVTDVVDCAMPRSSGGMFMWMLFNDGQIEPQRVDVAGLCLQALRELVRSRRLRLNTNPGDLFVTPELALLVTPVAVDVLAQVLRRRGHSFTRTEIYRALGDAGCLAGVSPGARRHTRTARIKSPAWRVPIRVHGLPIVHDALWSVQMPPGYFDGTVRIQG